LYYLCVIKIKESVLLLIDETNTFLVIINLPPRMAIWA